MLTHFNVSFVKSIARVSGCAFLVMEGGLVAVAGLVLIGAELLGIAEEYFA